MDRDAFLSARTRSFAAAALLAQLRFQPNAPLLRAMLFRQARYPPVRVHDRTAASARLLAGVPEEFRVGQAALQPGSWLNTICTPPARESQAEELVGRLRARGLDATQHTTSLTAVQRPQTDLGAAGLVRCLPDLVHVPLSPTGRECRRVADVVGEACGAAGGAACEPRAVVVQRSWTALQQSTHLRSARPRSVAELAEFVGRAGSAAAPLVVAGSGFSHGGHTTRPGAWHVDLSALAGVLAYDEEEHTVTALAGTSTGDVQQFLVARGRSLLVTQSCLGFSLGGSVAANAHGRSVRHSSLRDAVVRLAVMDSSGRSTVVEEGSPECTDTVGGLGLGGIVTEVTLRTSPDTLFVQQSRRCDPVELAQLARALGEQEREVYLWVRLRPDRRGDYRTAYVHTWTDTARPAPPVPPAEPGRLTRPVQRALLTSLYHGTATTTAAAYRVEHAVQRRRSGTTVARSHLSLPPVADQCFLPPPHRRWVNHVQEFFVPVDRLTTSCRTCPSCSAPPAWPC